MYESLSQRARGPTIFETQTFTTPLPRLQRNPADDGRLRVKQQLIYNNIIIPVTISVCFFYHFLRPRNTSNYDVR